MRLAVVWQRSRKTLTEILLNCFRIEREWNLKDSPWLGSFWEQQFPTGPSWLPREKHWHRSCGAPLLLSLGCARSMWKFLDQGRALHFDLTSASQLTCQAGLVMKGPHGKSRLLKRVLVQSNDGNLLINCNFDFFYKWCFSRFFVFLFPDS